MDELVVDILNQIFGAQRAHNDERGQLNYDCPMCSAEEYKEMGNGKGNLTINYKSGVWRCWVCRERNDMSGYLPKLIKRFGTPSQFKEYLRVKPEFTRVNTEKKEIIYVNKLPDGFIPLSKGGSKYDHNYNAIINYLKKRKIPDDIIKKYNIGYTTSGRYSGRVIIPSYDEFGDINYFVCRTVRKGIPYLNPDANKEVIIFNDKHICWDSTIYIVEGPFDHLVVPNSIPMLGKVLHDKLWEKLLFKANGLIVLVLDEDAETDAITLYHKLNSLGTLDNRAQHNRIRFVFMPKDIDISKLNELEGRKGVIKKLSTAIKLREDKLFKTKNRY